MKKNHFIMGSAIGLAAIAIAIDHTRHSLPQGEQQGMELYQIEGEAPGSLKSADGREDAGSPCSMGGSPCSM